jgi:roadblock/LC7 domain-containing protein
MKEDLMTQQNVAAVGLFADDGVAPTVEAPSDIKEVLAKMDEIVAKYEMGDALSDEDKEIVKAYLPVIGVDESGLSAENALVGSGTYDFKVEDKGLVFDVKGGSGCRGVGEGRIECWDDLSVSKESGDADVTNFKFIFRNASFGVGPTGVMKMTYKREFVRDFKSASNATASFFDRYTLTQWGFYFSITCEVSTAVGNVVIR